MRMIKQRRSTVVKLSSFLDQYQDDWFSMTFSITRQCNSDCSYCHYLDRLQKTPILSEDKFQELVSLITQTLIAHSKSFTQFVLTGGEPTLDLLRFLSCIEGVAPSVNRLVIFSNGTGRFPESDTRTNEFYTYLLNQYSNLYLTLTYHADAIDHEQFLTVLSTIPENLRCRVNVITIKDDAYADVVEHVTPQLNYPCHSTQIVPCKHIHGYSHPEKSVDVSESWNALINGKRNRFTGWLCEAGRKNLYISQNGNVWPCQGCSDDHSSNAKPAHFMGNLFENKEIELLAEPIKCPRKCCRMEMYLPKYSPDE